MGPQLAPRPATPTGWGEPHEDDKPAVEITELDALTLLVVVDNESDILSSVDPAIPKLSEVTHLLERTPVAHTHCSIDCSTDQASSLA